MESRTEDAKQDFFKNSRTNWMCGFRSDIQTINVTGVLLRGGANKDCQIWLRKGSKVDL